MPWSPPSDPAELDAFRQLVFDKAIEIRDQRLAKAALRQAARDRAAAKRLAVALRKQAREASKQQRGRVAQRPADVTLPP
jgi:hypothetical protein